MTTLDNLKKIVSPGESDQLEFKTKVNHPEKIIREMVAFANARGGNLLIGVSDDKKITGVKDPLEEMEILNKSLKDLVKPEIKYTVELIPVNRKRKVVFYKIKESRNKPHYVNPEPGSKKGIAYFRFRDRTIQASAELIDIIRKRRSYKKGYMLKYGHHEDKVIKSIDGKKFITISEIQEATGIGKKNVSKTLIGLVLANVVELEPRDGEDLYFSKRHL